MGILQFFDIPAVIQSHDLRHFVETGTGCGEGLEYASRFPFSTLWSCEIERALMEAAKPQFADDRVTLFLGPSSKMLEWLPRLPVDERILFWLDAHFPGADYGLHKFDDFEDAIRLPLQQELALIKQYRPANEDVILIDDARIWLDDAFEMPMVVPEVRTLCCPAARNIEFIADLFAATHRIDVLLNHQGYIVLSPYAVSEAMAVTATIARK